MKENLKAKADSLAIRIVLDGDRTTVAMMLELIDCEREAYKERALKVRPDELERLQGAVAGIERLKQRLAIE